MKYLTLLFCLTLSLPSLAKPNAETIKALEGDIAIYPVLHSAMAIEYQGQMIYVDPYGGAAGFDGLDKPDLILITDIHGDHMNIETLEELNAQSHQIIAPSAVIEKLGDKYTKTSALANGESTGLGDIKITAIPMYNLPQSADARHTKGRGNGYLLSMGGKNIYISGDTEDIAEMRALKNIDAAFVCMNLPYTMTVEAAASAVLEFQPKIIYPFHYRGKGGFADVGKFEQLINEGNKDIEVRLASWYPEK